MSAEDRGGLSAEHSTNVACHSFPASQQNTIREQLDRILASSLFRNSKRFPQFLRYTVNCVLAKDTDKVKERTIGIEVFGRDPNYDTSADPVVRVTAAEVRKRLSQYYHELGHEHELRIEFARGSYIPEIKFPSENVLPDVLQEERLAVVQPATESRNSRQWLLIAGLTAPYIVVLFVFLLGSTRQTTLDRFLSPITSSSTPVLLCIPGQSSEPAPQARVERSVVPGAQTTTQVRGVGHPDRVSFGDSMALSTLTGVLGRKGVEFHVRHTEDASLEDLKSGPVVLIGGFSNHWTMQLGGGLRFSFAHDGALRYIADQRNPSSREWAVSAPPDSSTRFADYAIISRVSDATTGRVLVTVAGIRHFGTQSAAECLTDSTCLAAAERLAPGDWRQANIQVVLKTPVIGNDAGQPQVVAAFLW